MRHALPRWFGTVGFLLLTLGCAQAKQAQDKEEGTEVALDESGQSAEALLFKSGQRQRAGQRRVHLGVHKFRSAHFRGGCDEDAGTPDSVPTSSAAPSTVASAVPTTVASAAPSGGGSSTCATPFIVAGPINAVNDAELAALTGVSAITGTLTLGADVSALAPLRCLTRVGGLVVTGNTKLSDLAGLEQLAEADVLKLSSNTALRSLHGLSSLDGVRVVDILSNSALLDVDLPGLTRVSASSAGFSNYLHIDSNGALTNLDGLSNLTRIDGGIGISSNASLVSVAGLHNLVQSRGLDVKSNPQLTNLDGLDGLTGVDLSEISDNAQLKDLRGLRNLRGVGVLTLARNPALSALTGLESLAYVGELDVRDNAALASLAGLSGLNLVRSLWLIGNPLLAQLDGLEQLTTVDDGLSINGNATLSSLHGLSGLVSVGLGAGGGTVRLYIEDNPRLPTCAESVWLLRRISIPAAASVDVLTGNLRDPAQPACNAL